MQGEVVSRLRGQPVSSLRTDAGQGIGMARRYEKTVVYRRGRVRQRQASSF